MNLTMTFEIFVRRYLFFSKFSVLVATLTLVSYVLPASASEPEASEIVGQVSLALGKAYIDNPAMERRKAAVGTLISVNDQVITAANGHVHIRFVDQALVSVRPDSRLEIVNYSYNARQPERSVVKFNLIEGVTRSISGDAASSARERFRLNTPIAAIGVRGTDFVVSASEQSVRALVNEGTIVMAPYSDDCTADSFGPCETDALELSGDSLQILELNSENSSTLAASLERDPGIMQENLQASVTEAGGNENGDVVETLESEDVYRETVTSSKVTEEAAQVRVEFTPSHPLSADVLANRQLSWGRWFWSDGQGDLERITLDYETASFSKKITVSTGDYGLFRSDAGFAQVDRGLGVVGFDLNSAQAFYNSDNGVVAMQVKGGSLDINFDQNTFATILNLNHDITGAINFAASGGVSPSGVFLDRSDSQNLAGAVSQDGAEAAYFFNRQLETGGIHGLTIWDSQ